MFEVSKERPIFCIQSIAAVVILGIGAITATLLDWLNPDEIWWLGALWVANILLGVLHYSYWKQYGLPVIMKIIAVFQLLLVIFPVFLGAPGILLVYLMLGGHFTIGW